MKNFKLIQARKAKGLTQEELAFKLDYKKSTISNWENGYSNPKMDDAFKVSEILGTDIKTLFFNQKEQDSHTNTA
ncbi:helix-turn-helix transcriptional regulator [Bacillus safensis]|uniref:helix-turn-helix transcriptional regulator n=1 Tax=Bacillus TaxID=1386 RepID=UPI000E70D482|nr:helix-turn-helix transcriptional regulator [Bacillus safensis]MCY1093655.1 helix-turn-helix transcriptional regulator [Bacillus safensis]RKE76773.1 DNA-binding XRE family transcriptional regulator [Bacillus safensis]